MVAPLPSISVTPDWLYGQAGDDIVVADVRWIPDGSVPRCLRAWAPAGCAISFDLDRDLARPAFQGPGRHPLPSPASFARTMRDAGIGDDTPVVAYDDVGGGWPRGCGGCCMSRAIRRRCSTCRRSRPGRAGRDLRSGAERAAERPARSASARGPPIASSTPARFGPAVERLGRRARRRAGERYRGEVEPIDPVAGHIPGAVNAPWQGDRQDERRGDLLSRTRCACGTRTSACVRATRSIASCGSGVTASFAVFTMELAGLPGAKLYEGSWSTGSTIHSRPVATGRRTRPDAGRRRRP